ncbi:MAG TPA: DUF2127 domain-containing protein [Myxococcales bacterium]|jgi:uncharacterized membrane protein (DUF2068 family)|nr:DUF2127 domain-containing protein [Myxococcales bacterium]
MKKDAGVQAIIAYKLFKAVAELLLGVAASYLVLRGAEAGAAELAQFILEHFARHWALTAATLIVKGGTSSHVKAIAVLAYGDAVLSAVEGIALRAQKWWAPWLVVIATGSLLPWELWELMWRPTWIRFVLFILNVAVVAYLLRAVAREHKQLQRVDAQPERP